MDKLNEESKCWNTSLKVVDDAENSHNQGLKRPLLNQKAEFGNKMEGVCSVKEEQLMSLTSKSPREIFATEYEDPSRVTIEEELDDGKFRLAQHLARTKRLSE